MKATFNNQACKRPVNLTLNEDVVVQVRGLTNNLSGVAELLLAGDVDHERHQSLAKVNTVEATVSMWNAFNARHGSFADEYSTL